MSASLPDRLRRQAEHCAAAGSLLNARLLTGAADDYDAQGPAYDLLAPHAGDPPGSVPALRLCGALHRLVLERRAPALAVHYPSVGGTVGDVWPAARQVLVEQPAVVAELLHRPVQTNEVGRSSVLLGGLLLAQATTPLPVRLLEVGASGGLNLLFDSYAHDVAPGVVLGDPASAVSLVRPWHGWAGPYGTVAVERRAGCDPAPLDPRSAQDRLTLTSYVWADQLGRFERLRAALAVAAAAPVAVERLGAADFLGRELATARPGVLTVVWHSVVRQYLAPEERARVEALLAEAGDRASADAPLVHLAMEGARVGEEHAFTLTLTSWPGGDTRVLADCEGHGPPVRWR